MPKRSPTLFDLLFRRHGRELLVFASQRAGDDAEDLVQDAYLRLLQHEDPLTIGNPRAYLYKVTANAAVDHRRKQRVRESSAEYLDDFDALPSHLPTPETEAETALQLQHCRTALEQLPDIQRHVFLLHRIDGWSHAEIAEALKIPRRTVERHCAKALAHCFAFTGRGRQ